MKTKKVRPAPPQYESIPDFLTKREAKETFSQIIELPGFAPETGSCELIPTHQTLHFGPRQSYLDCVPQIFRVTSAGDQPPFLAYLCTRIEEMFDVTFNSCQINYHAPDSVVHRHGDSNPGHVCMISLGQEREFVLSYQKPYNIPFARLPLPDGSLLSFLPKDQYKMCHEMPKLKDGANAERRISIIFRYIPQIVTEKMLKTCTSEKEKDAYRIARDREYQAAQVAGRAARAGLLKNPKYASDTIKQAQAVREKEHRYAAATVDYNNRAAAAAIVAARHGIAPTEPDPSTPSRLQKRFKDICKTVYWATRWPGHPAGFLGFDCTKLPSRKFCLEQLERIADSTATYDRKRDIKAIQAATRRILVEFLEDNDGVFQIADETGNEAETRFHEFVAAYPKRHVIRKRFRVESTRNDAALRHIPEPAPVGAA